MARCLHFLNYRLESLSADRSDTANVFAVRGFVISTGQKKCLTNLVSHFFMHIFLLPLEVKVFSYILEDRPIRKITVGTCRYEVPGRGEPDLTPARRSG